MRFKLFFLSLILVSIVIYSCQEMSPVVAPDNQSPDIQLQTEKKKSDLAVASTEEGTSFTLADQYIVEFSGSPDDLENMIAEYGGTAKGLHPQIGIATVSGIDSKQAEKLNKKGSIKNVTQDMIVKWVNPAAAKEQSIGSDESFFGYQWALPAIHAPEAWDAGARGAGVRVAVIDGGLWYVHPDLEGNVDVNASASFPDTIGFWEDVSGHATHVAGIIAAIDNDWGVIGVAPEATIIGLKALHDGSGSFGEIINAIMYAADFADADVINMSLGAYLPKNQQTSHLKNAISSAITHAYQNGVTVIASAGNDGIDMDHVGPWIHVPGDLVQAINISATGPLDFAYGSIDFDRPASYTNYGQSVIDFAAPGGDFASPNDLWYYDMVLSTTIGGWSWMAGTSMASPHVAGVAALIIEKNGGSMHPAQVAAALRRSADDLGKPGNDDYYGQGRVNAYQAVTQ